MNWINKITIPVSRTSIFESIRYWLLLVIAQAEDEQLPLIELQLETDHYVLMLKSDFDKWFGE